MCTIPRDGALRTGIRDDPIPVLYAGDLPAFRRAGSHPQFHLLDDPPPGYRFVRIVADRRSPVGRLMRYGGDLIRLPTLARPTLKLARAAIRLGARVPDVTRFIRSRIRGALSVEGRHPRLALLPTWPYALGRVPWMIEIEDVVTLFAPFAKNGQTSSLDIFRSPFYLPVKALLESESCRAIICHVQSTAAGVPTLFRSDALRHKTFHVPLGIHPPPRASLRRRAKDDPVTILFTNSWHQDPSSFYVRGGLDTLAAFSLVSARHRNVKLVLRSRLPPDLDGQHLEIIKTCDVEVVDRFLPDDELHALLMRADIYVLPSARIHAVSLLQAMAYGLALVVSDGWGIEDYVEDGRNGLIVRGRYGKCSWMDGDGMLREDYSPLWSVDPIVVRGLADALSTLIENHELRERLAGTARRHVETRFTIDNWNRGLEQALRIAVHGTGGMASHANR